jgi:DNA-binding IclR family transcriptional regulator
LDAGLAKEEICRRLNLSKTTVYRIYHELLDERGQQVIIYDELKK